MRTNTATSWLPLARMLAALLPLMPAVVAAQTPTAAATSPIRRMADALTKVNASRAEADRCGRGGRQCHAGIALHGEPIVESADTEPFVEAGAIIVEAHCLRLRETRKHRAA